MLTPDQLEALPRRFVQLWQQVEDDILQDIARRIRKLGDLDPLTPTAIWQAWRLAETRAVRSNTVATLAKYTGKSRAEIKRLLETAGAQTMAADDAVYTAAGLDPPPVNQSPALLNLLNAGYRQTCGTWQNLTATTANTVTGAFEDRLSRAWGLVSTGALDYSTAIRRAVDDLADTMPYITYPSGHTDTLEVAARRAVLTGVNQTCAKLQLARMEEMDCEFVEVTAHGGARPTHAVWQGRVYHRGGAVVQDGERYEDFETATGYGTGPGLCGWNCRHNFYPFYPGISVRNYTDERLAELDARNIPYGGGLYTRYEITQMQRALERRVRKYKRRYLAETAAGVDASQSAAKLKAARQQLSAFLAETGERLDGARAEVPGFGQREAKQADAAAKHFTAENTLTNAAGQPIIKTERSSVTGHANGITQRQNTKDGIDRNYYGPDGKQTKQISNNNHGHKKESAFGLHGEHAHDYTWDQDGHVHHLPARELTEAERKENSDIL
ncbi:MAG: phage minor capsid protein [Gemmiger qucibialis]|nr:phage minor capsid protein [Gemmiger qucibialis]